MLRKTTFLNGNCLKKLLIFLISYDTIQPLEIDKSTFVLMINKYKDKLERLEK